MGPLTVIERLLAPMAPSPCALLAGAADTNPAGERCAAGVLFERVAPPGGADWNDLLVQ